MPAEKDRFRCLVGGGNWMLNNCISDTIPKTIEQLGRESGYEKNARSHVDRMFNDGLLVREKNSNGIFAYTANLDKVTPQPPDLADNLLELAERQLKATTRKQLINARIGQGEFRKQVLEKWGHACAVTGCELVEVIRASHIKPWASSNDDERLDPSNGLPLVASLDALFDVGLISFADDGAILISRRVTEADRERLGLAGFTLRACTDSRTSDYLSEHRATYFPTKG